VEIFRLNVIDVGHATMTLEVQGREDKMGAIVDLLEPYGESGGAGFAGSWAGFTGSWAGFTGLGKLVSIPDDECFVAWQCSS
jgi:hypothetical protein